MATIIRTNLNVRQFLYRNQVPDNVLKSKFDWLSDDDVDMFIRYKGEYYHVSEFSATDGNSTFRNWDGYISDSYFSGVLIKYVKGVDGGYMIGTYFS